MQALEQLPEVVARTVLQASPLTLDQCLPQLHEPFRALAIHSACPEIAAEGSLVLKCDDHEPATCTAALDILSSLPQVNSLTLREVSYVLSYTGTLRGDVKNFAFALNRALSCNLTTVHVHFAAISPSQLPVLAFSLLQNTAIQTLHLSLPVLSEEHDELLAGTLGQLTTLQHLHIDVRSPGNEFGETHHKAMSCLSSLTGLTYLHLRHFCNAPAGSGAELGKCIAAMPQLQHLHACVFVRFDSDTDLDMEGDMALFAGALSQLTCMRTLHLKVEMHQECDDEHQRSTSRAFHVWPAPHQAAFTELAQSIAALRQLTALVLHCEGRGSDRSQEARVSQYHGPSDSHLQPLLNALAQLLVLQTLSFNVAQVGTMCCDMMGVLRNPAHSSHLTSLTIHRGVPDATQENILLGKRSGLHALQHLSIEESSAHNGHIPHCWPTRSPDRS